MEKDILSLSGNEAQQVSFIIDRLISDKLKWLYNLVSLTACHSSMPVYFFASRIIQEREDEPVAIEIKAAEEFNSSMLRGLHYWLKYQPASKTSIILYGGGTTTIIDEKMSAVSWKDIGDI